MTLDPSARRMLDMMRASGSTPIDQAQDLAEARRSATQGVIAIGLDPPPGVIARDAQTSGQTHAVPVRIYRPETVVDRELPVLLFLHGGGWVVGDLDSHDHLCRHLAAGADCCVIAVDYRLAPEHPFPAAVEDSIEALRWVSENAEDLNIDGARIALCGDSAGGNLAAVASLDAAARGGPPIRLQLLIYPVCDLVDRAPSYVRNGRDYVLPASSMEFFIASYCPDPHQAMDWRASPSRASDLHGSPPTILYTAEYDVLHDEGEAFAAALREAGVDVVHRDVAGHMHGFVTSGKLIPAAAEVIAEIVGDLRRAFA